MGFGDGRNFQLLHNAGFDLYGVEIDKNIIINTQKRLQDNDISANLVLGSNDDIPFEDNFFDTVFSSFSLYYLRGEKKFSDNLAEVNRILKPKKGSLFATLADSNTFVFRNAESLGEGYYKITDDPFELRNGDILKAHDSAKEIKKVLKSYGFNKVALGHTRSNYFGLKLSYFIVQAKFE